MSETANTSSAELFDAMVATYETWAEPLGSCFCEDGCTDRTLDMGWKFRPAKIEAIKIWNKYYN